MCKALIKMPLELIFFSMQVLYIISHLSTINENLLFEFVVSVLLINVTEV